MAIKLDYGQTVPMAESEELDPWVKGYDWVPYEGVEVVGGVPQGPYKSRAVRVKLPRLQWQGKWKKCVNGYVSRGSKYGWSPVGCNSLKCEHCGPKIVAQLRMAWYTGMVDAGVEGGVCLVTLTVPAPKVQPFAYRRPDRIKFRLPAEDQDADVWARRDWTYAEWQEAMQQPWLNFLRVMRRWWKKRGLELAGIKTLEFTVQKYPHIHFVVYDKLGATNWYDDFREMAAKTWARVGPCAPSLERGTHVSRPGDYHNGKYVQSAAHAFNYATKYIAKAWRWVAPRKHAYESFGQPFKVLKVYRDIVLHQKYSEVTVDKYVQGAKKVLDTGHQKVIQAGYSQMCHCAICDVRDDKRIGIAQPGREEFVLNMWDVRRERAKHAATKAKRRQEIIEWYRSIQMPCDIKKLEEIIDVEIPKPGWLVRVEHYLQFVAPLRYTYEYWDHSGSLLEGTYPRPETVGQTRDGRLVRLISPAQVN